MHYADSCYESICLFRCWLSLLLTAVCIEEGEMHSEKHKHMTVLVRVESQLSVRM
jgi:hypothetical protein